MSTELTTSEHQAAPPSVKRSKPLRISPKIRKAISLLTSGECRTQKAAAIQIGISEPYLSTQLNKAHIRVFIEQRCRENIVRGTLRASNRIVELIDAKSEHVAAEVSTRILESEGILRSNEAGVHVNVGVSIAPGYVIDLRGITNDAAVIGHQPTIDAKPLNVKEDVQRDE